MIKTNLWLTRRQLSSESPQKRLKAVQKLRGMNDPEAVEVLIAALEDPETAVRSEVVAALGDFKDPAVVRALINTLRDTSEVVQELAVQALKRIGDPSAIEPIAGVLLRGSPKVQIQAANALRALGWAPRTMGEQIPYYVATGDFKRVLMFGPAAMSALLAVLRGGSDERRVEVAAILAESGDPSVVKPLTAALKDKEPSVRAAAAAAVARLGDPQLSAALLPLLKDRARTVRVAVVNALGKLGDLHALELLTDLAEDREWEVRTVLAEALGRLKDARALPTVLQLLGDPDQEVRQSAAAALGQIGDEANIEVLLLAMVDEHMGVRQAAARSLVMVEPYWERSERVRALLPKLQQAMSDNDPAVQAAAAVLLRRLTGRNAAELLASENRPVALQNDKLVEVFNLLMGDSDECVRLAAAEALGRLRLPIGIQSLQNGLRDPSKWVKQAAERGLEIITSRMRH